MKNDMNAIFNDVSKYLRKKYISTKPLEVGYITGGLYRLITSGELIDEPISGLDDIIADGTEYIYKKYSKSNPLQAGIVSGYLNRMSSGMNLKRR